MMRLLPPPDDDNRPRPAHNLFEALRHRYPQAALAVATGQAAWPAARAIRSRVEQARTYTIKILGDDEIYDDVHAWVLSQLAPSSQRALIAFSGQRHGYDGDPYDMSDEDEPASLSTIKLRYDGNREQAISITGHRVKVATNENTNVITSGNGNGNATASFKPPEIVFTASSVAGRNAVITELRRLAEQRSAIATRQPRFRIYGSWGSWETIGEMPERPLSSVILPGGQLTRIITDIDRFLAAEAVYNRRGIPWHRGHFYTGVPGTGKTSLARALASHFRLDVWLLPLGDVQKDGDLLKRISGLTPRSILILEDVDVLGAAQHRELDNDDVAYNTGPATPRNRERGDDSSGGVSLAGILNALDGIATPHGLITIMTSNRPGVLDDALVRPGRIDLIEEFTVATAEQARRIIAYYYGVDHQVITDRDANMMAGCTPAAIIEACKRHDVVEDAIAEVIAMKVHNAMAP